jgi:hypothetical protein
MFRSMMRVPPTSLRIPEDALSYFTDHQEALRFLRDMNGRPGAVVIDGDEVIHGSLFVAAAIFLGDWDIPVMTIQEYERQGLGGIKNPCAEIALGLMQHCNLGVV